MLPISIDIKSGAIKSNRNANEFERLGQEAPSTRQERECDKVGEVELMDCTPAAETEKILIDESVRMDSDDANNLMQLRTDVPIWKQEDLFAQELRQCCVLYDFKNAAENLVAKQAKTTRLQNIFAHLSIGEGVLSERICEGLVEMVACNIIRPMSPNKLPEGFVDADPIVDAAWQQLELVYNVFICYLKSQDFNLIIAEYFVDRKFVFNVLKLLGSHDSRERYLLTTVIYLIYSQFFGLRYFIRNALLNILMHYIHASEEFNGIDEVVLIYNRIVKTIFNRSLVVEYNTYFSRVLLPLYKSDCLPTFHANLRNGIVHFLELDPNRIVPTVQAMIKYWPMSNSPKEITLLGDLGMYMKLMGQEQFVKVQDRLFVKIARSLSSAHFDIAGHALTLISTEHTMKLIDYNFGVVMPILLPAFLATINWHWNDKVRKHAKQTFKLLAELNADLFNEIFDKYTNDPDEVEQRQRNREEAWKIVQELADNRLMKTAVVSLKDQEDVDMTDLSKSN